MLGQIWPVAHSLLPALDGNHETGDGVNDILKPFQDFPGGAVVKNPPANAGNTGSSPGPGRSHMPRSN